MTYEEYMANLQRQQHVPTPFEQLLGAGGTPYPYGPLGGFSVAGQQQARQSMAGSGQYVPKTQQQRFGLDVENCKRGIGRLQKYRLKQQPTVRKHVDSRVVEPKACKQLKGS